MSQTSSILFVCLGNICRSPAAECALRNLIKTQKLAADALRIDSAGTADWNVGNPPDPRMKEAGSARGLTIDGEARQVRLSDFTGFDLIVAMDRENLSELESLAEKAGGEAPLQLFSAFCSEDAPHDIPDPYWGEEDGFTLVLDLIEEGCRGIIKKLL